MTDNPFFWMNIVADVMGVVLIAFGWWLVFLDHKLKGQLVMFIGFLSIVCGICQVPEMVVEKYVTQRVKDARIAETEAWLETLPEEEVFDDEVIATESEALPESDDDDSAEDESFVLTCDRSLQTDGAGPSGCFAFGCNDGVVRFREWSGVKMAMVACTKRIEMVVDKDCYLVEEQEGPSIFWSFTSHTWEHCLDTE